jgi:hypothetical protein
LGCIRPVSLVPALELGGRWDTSQGGRSGRPCSLVLQHGTGVENVESLNHTIFERTSEIQQLVIARAISGLRIQ